MNTSQNITTASGGPAAPTDPVPLGCPRCGCALLLMQDDTQDIYIGELRRRGTDLREIVAVDATWAKGLREIDELLGCSRCLSGLGESDLVPVSDQAADEAWREIARLAKTVNNNWEGDPEDGAAAHCPACNSPELVIRVERTAQLAAFFQLEQNDCVDWAERWLQHPWDVKVRVQACNSCLKRLEMCDLVWQQ